MKRMLSVVLAVMAIAAAANAASLSVAADKLTYSVGETVTLTVTGDDGATYSYGIFGQLDYNGALVDNGTRSQMTLVGVNGVPWSKGVLNAADNGVTAFSYAFSQLTGIVSQTATNLPAAFATVTLIAKAVGFVNVDWHTTPGATQLEFFGLTNAPGTSFIIGVPEASTSVLLGLGLLVLARRRSR